MLKSMTVKQMIDVLESFKVEYQRHHVVTKAYQTAVDKVSKKYGVAYQTIGDLCSRRMRLESINAFYNLLEKWMLGKPEPLKQLILRNTDTSARHEIVEYFGNVAQGISGCNESFLEEELFETFSIQLQKEKAKKLKVLSIMNSLSVSDKLREQVEKAIEDEYRIWLRKQA